jgi:hypothetical protein
MGAPDKVTLCRSAEGRPINEIAGQKTVEWSSSTNITHHRTFSLKCNADLVLFALKHGVVSMDSNSSQQSLSS